VLGSQDVGHRVVVRRVVGVRDERPVFTDILGELREYTDEDLAVETRRGLVRVPLAAIVAAKRIPPRRS
jgi:hypothetical protein